MPDISDDSVPLPGSGIPSLDSKLSIPAPGSGLAGVSGTSSGSRVSSVKKAQTNDINKAVGRVAKATSSKTDIPGTIGLGNLVTSPVNKNDPQIYLGADSPIAFVPASQAAQMYYQWDAKTKNKFLSQLSLAGYDTSSIKDSDIAQLWVGYVKAAAQYSLAGKQLSPWDILGKDIAQRSGAASKPKTTTATQQSYNISTAEDAAALFQGAAQTLLGRDPTKDEQARFKAVLTKYEQANPATTTTTSTYLGSDLQNQTSTTTGGVSAATQSYIAEEEAKKNPEYGAYQAATNGMNWLMEMLGG